MGELNGKDTPSVVELQVIGAKNVAGALRTLHLHCGSKLAITSPSFATAALRSANVPNTGNATLMALIASIFSVVVMLQKFVPLRVLLMCFCGSLYLFGFILNLCRLVIECLCGNSPAFVWRGLLNLRIFGIGKDLIAKMPVSLVPYIQF